MPSQLTITLSAATAVLPSIEGRYPDGEGTQHLPLLIPYYDAERSRILSQAELLELRNASSK